MDSSRTPERESTPDIETYITKLHGAIFSGWYTERIWIDDLKVYLDQIKVDEDEVQIIKNLRSVNRRLKKIRPGFTGIELDPTKNDFILILKGQSFEQSLRDDFHCITKNDICSDESVNLYVDWSNRHSKIIGHYWFMIDSVNLGPTFMQFNLRILRQVSGNEKSSGRCPHCGKLPLSDTHNSSTDDPLNLSEIARNLQWKFRDIITPSDWWTDVKPHLTLDNIFRFGKFLIVLLLAAISGTGNFLIHIASHTNRFVHALSGLMRTSTPFLLACLDVVNRFIAGLFTLIAMMWRDARRPPGQSPQETANRLAYERNDARQKFLEGPSYPYRRDVNRPYMK